MKKLLALGVVVLFVGTAAMNFSGGQNRVDNERLQDR
jgi:hypothetical protein